MELFILIEADSSKRMKKAVAFLDYVIIAGHDAVARGPPSVAEMH